MTTKWIASALAATLMIGALVTKIAIDHRALRALRQSHEVRVRFCRGYRGSIRLMRDELDATKPLEVRHIAYDDYHLLANGSYDELCHVDRKQLEPEASHVGLNCDLPDELSCYQRAAAKLERSIPDDFDP